MRLSWHLGRQVRRPKHDGALLSRVVPTYLFCRASSYVELLICAGLFGLAATRSRSASPGIRPGFRRTREGDRVRGVWVKGNVGRCRGQIRWFLLVPGIRRGQVLAGGYLGGWLPGRMARRPRDLLGVPGADGRTDRLAGRCCPTSGRSRMALRDIIAPLRFGARMAVQPVLMWLRLAFFIPCWLLKFTSTDTFSLHAARCTPPCSSFRPACAPGGLALGQIRRASSHLLGICRHDGGACRAGGSEGEYLGIAHQPTALMFAALMSVLGSCMGIGSSIFKYIPDYFPMTRAVGGLVGMLGYGRLLSALKGRTTGIPQM